MKNIGRLEKILLVCAVVAILSSLSMSVYATPQCDHPNFYVKGCEYPELNGKDGKDGIDGIDGTDGRDGLNGADGRDGARGEQGERGPQGIAGTDGRDGIDGTNGKDGADGRDGRDGVDGKSFSRSAIDRIVAATNALDIHQSTEGHRATFGASRVNGATGLGVGYSYRDDDNRVYKLGVSRSGSETLVKGSLSLEF